MNVDEGVLTEYVCYRPLDLWFNNPKEESARPIAQETGICVRVESCVYAPVIYQPGPGVDRPIDLISIVA